MAIRLPDSARPMTDTELLDEDKENIRWIEDRILAVCQEVHKSSPTEVFWATPQHLRTPRIILIDGKRGMGKTSLLLTVLDRWADERADQRASTRRRRHEPAPAPDKLHRDQDVLAIPILDFEPMPPGLPLFAWVIQAFEGLVRVVRETDRAQGRSPNASQTPRLEDAWERLHDDAVSAWMVDREGPSRERSATEARRVRNWRNLGSSWRSLVNRLRDLLVEEGHLSERGVLVVPLDDVDMQVERAPEILRTLNNLEHPKVVFLLTGNKDLLSSAMQHSFDGQVSALRRGTDKAKQNLATFGGEVDQLGQLVVEKYLRGALVLKLRPRTLRQALIWKNETLLQGMNDATKQRWHQAAPSQLHQSLELTLRQISDMSWKLSDTPPELRSKTLLSLLIGRLKDPNEMSANIERTMKQLTQGLKPLFNELSGERRPSPDSPHHPENTTQRLREILYQTTSQFVERTNANTSLEQVISMQELAISPVGPSFRTITIGWSSDTDAPQIPHEIALRFSALPLNSQGNALLDLWCSVHPDEEPSQRTTDLLWPLVMSGHRKGATHGWFWPFPTEGLTNMVERRARLATWKLSIENAKINTVRDLVVLWISQLGDDNGASANLSIGDLVGAFCASEKEEETSSDSLSRFLYVLPLAHSMFELPMDIRREITESIASAVGWRDSPQAIEFHEPVEQLLLKGAEQGLEYWYGDNDHHQELSLDDTSDMVAWTSIRPSHWREDLNTDPLTRLCMMARFGPNAWWASFLLPTASIWGASMKGAEIPPRVQRVMPEIGPFPGRQVAHFLDYWPTGEALFGRRLGLSSAAAESIGRYLTQPDRLQLLSNLWGNPDWKSLPQPIAFTRFLMVVWRWLCASQPDALSWGPYLVEHNSQFPLKWVGPAVSVTPATIDTFWVPRAWTFPSEGAPADRYLREALASLLGLASTFMESGAVPVVGLERLLASSAFGGIQLPEPLPWLEIDRFRHAISNIAVAGDGAPDKNTTESLAHVQAETLRWSIYSMRFGLSVPASAPKIDTDARRAIQSLITEIDALLKLGESLSDPIENRILIQLEQLERSEDNALSADQIQTLANRIKDARDSRGAATHLLVLGQPKDDKHPAWIRPEEISRAMPKARIARQLIQATTFDPDRLDFSSEDWNRHVENMKKVGEDVRSAIMTPTNTVSHVLVAALGRTPILIALGSSLGEQFSIETIHKGPGSPWGWSTHSNGRAVMEVVRPPADRTGPIALLISIANPILQADLPAPPFGENWKCWELRIAQPGFDAICTTEDRTRFVDTVRDLVLEMLSAAPNAQSIYLFPEVSAALAVELGRLYRPQFWPDLQIYEHRNNHWWGPHCIKGRAPILTRVHSSIEAESARSPAAIGEGVHQVENYISELLQSRKQAVGAFWIQAEEGFPYVGMSVRILLVTTGSKRGASITQQTLAASNTRSFSVTLGLVHPRDILREYESENTYVYKTYLDNPDDDIGHSVDRKYEWPIDSLVMYKNEPTPGAAPDRSTERPI
jgi:hypothetical protein